MDRYALEDGNENAGDGEADDEVVAPEEDAAELDDGEDAVLEEDAAVLFCQICLLGCVGVLVCGGGGEGRGRAHTWSI